MAVEDPCGENIDVAELLARYHGLSAEGTNCCTKSLFGDENNSHCKLFSDLLHLLDDWASADNYIVNLLHVARSSRKPYIAGFIARLLQNKVCVYSRLKFEKNELDYGRLDHRPTNTVIKLEGMLSYERFSNKQQSGLESMFEVLKTDKEAGSKHLKPVVDHLSDFMKNTKICLWDGGRKNILDDAIRGDYKLSTFQMRKLVADSTCELKSDVIKWLVHVLFQVMYIYRWHIEIISCAIQFGFGDDELFRVLLGLIPRLDDDPRDGYRMLLESAVCSGKVDLTRILLESPCCRCRARYIDVSLPWDCKTGDTLLHMAASLGLWLRYLALYELPDETPLSFGEMKMRKVFGCSTKIETWDVFSATSCPGSQVGEVTGDEERTMLKVFRNIDEENFVSIFEMLIRRGAQVNVRNKLGITPLHVLANSQVSSASRCLSLISRIKAPLPAVVVIQGWPTSYDANLNNYMKTITQMEWEPDQKQPPKLALLHPEMAGIAQRHFQCIGRLIAILVENKADINARDNMGCTPLMLAVFKSNACLKYCTTINIIERRSNETQLTATHILENQVCISGEQSDIEATTLFLRSHIFTVVRSILNNGADWRIKNNKGVGAFYFAVEFGQTELVEELIRRGADVDDRSIPWTQYFASVAMVGAEPNIFTLLEHDITIDKRNSKDETALHIVSELNLPTAVNILLHHGAAVNAPASYGQTPLHVAAIHNCSFCVPVLLSYGADLSLLDNEGNNPLTIALMKGGNDVALVIFMHIGDGILRLDDVKTPLSQIVQYYVHEVREGLLNMACAVDNAALVAEILRLGVDVNKVNSFGETALHTAARNNASDVISVLVDSGADVCKIDTCGHTPLATALYYGSWKAANALLTCCPRIIDLSHTHFLAVLDECYAFLEEGYDKNLISIFMKFHGKLRQAVEVSTMDRNTLLHNAGTPQLAKFLIDNGADLNSQNSQGQTPLHKQFSVGEWDTALFLLQNGADINISDETGKTPLQYAPEYLSVIALDACEGKWNRYRKFSQREPFRHYCTEHEDFVLYYDYADIRDRFRPMITVVDGIRYFSLCSGPTEYVVKRLREESGLLNEIAQFRDIKGNSITKNGNNITLSIVTPGQLHFVAHNEKQFECVFLKLISSSVDVNEFLLQKDSRGRTALHDYFLFEVVVSEFFVDMLYANDQLRNVVRTRFEDRDADGRTPLHYAAATMSKSTVFCEKFMSTFGVNWLGTCDKRGHTAITFARIAKHDKPQWLRWRDMTISERQSWLMPYTPSLVCATREIKNSDFVIVGNMLTNGNHRHQVPFPEELLHRCSVSLAVKNIWKVHCLLKEYWDDKPRPLMNRIVSGFFVRLVAALSVEDPRLEGRPWPIGSSSEGTKIHDHDEFDLNIELTRFSQMCRGEPSSVTGFYVLQRAGEMSKDDSWCDEFFDENGMLLARKLNACFQNAMSRTLCRQMFWDNEQFLEIISSKSVCENKPDHFCKCITLQLKRQVSNVLLPGFQISIDLVPVVRLMADRVVVEGVTPLYHSIVPEGYFFVIDQPYRKYRVPYSSTEHVRISFAVADSRRLRNGPAALTISLAVAKRISEEASFNIGSYALKMAALCSTENLPYDGELYHAKPKRHKLTSESDPYDVSPEKLQRHVEALFRQVYQFVIQDYVPCFFMPSFHAPIWKFDKCLGYSHLILRQRNLDYESLFRMYKRHTVSYGYFKENLENVMRSVGDSLRSCYLIYRMCSSDNNALTEWTFPPISYNETDVSSIGCCMVDLPRFVSRYRKLQRETFYFTRIPIKLKSYI